MALVAQAAATLNVTPLMPRNMAGMAAAMLLNTAGKAVGRMRLFPGEPLTNLATGASAEFGNMELRIARRILPADAKLGQRGGNLCWRS